MTSGRTDPDQEPPLPATGRTSLRRSLLAAAVAGLVLLALAAIPLARWWTAEPWTDLEDTAATFSPPDGFELHAQFRLGDRPAVCQIKPSCDEPRLRVEYQQADGRELSCDLLEASVDAWRQSGFSLDQSRGGNLETPCIFDGDIDGHTTQVLGITDVDGVPGAAVIVWD